MSLAYDKYLAEHIGNVNKGLHWMLDNLGLGQEEKSAIEDAMLHEHDSSKYDTEEYEAYDKYFYGGNLSYKVVKDFNYAWLHHIHKNPHHWQYWVLLEDDPESGTPYKALEIPMPYIFEMIADWWSFSWKEGNLFEIFNWYADHRSKQIINPKSREIVEYILKKIWDVLIMQETIAGHDISEIEKQYKRFWAEQDVDLLNWDHPSAQVIGKVVDARETENGLEVTVEHSDEKDALIHNPTISKLYDDIKHSDTENTDEDHLEHHGILGQKWGIRRYQNYDGSLTEAGRERYGRPSTPVHYDNKKDPRFKQTVFVSGSSKTQNEDSPYYRKELPKDIRKELDRYVKDGDTILVGDAPGIDRQVQDYLNSKKYDNVEVYGPGKQVRYSANKKWKTNPIDDPDHEEGSTEWLAKKDEAMAERASDGIAIILDEGAKATRKNVGRLADMGKNVSVYQLDKNGLDLDRWFDESELLDIMGTEVSKLYDDIKHSDTENTDEDHLEHHGILGQKWGVRRYQNKDGTRTAEGKKLEHYRRRTIRELGNVDDVNKIVASLPREEQLALGVGREDKAWIPEDRRAEISSNIAKTFIEYDGDEPVSMLEIWDIGDGKADIALATNPKYRGTGVTSKNIKAAVDWFNSGNNKEFDQLQWNNLKMNSKSGQIAEHYGFGDYDEDDKWEYRRIFKNEPIKHSDTEDDEDLYGIPELKKFPMPDKKHVKSAIRFFNYVDPKHEKELAEAILEKAEEFGLDLENDISVGDENRLKKYLKKEDSQ